MKRIVHIGFWLLAFGFSFFLLGCEKVLEIEDDPAAKQLVLNAVPQAGDTSFVYFAQTRFFLDTAAEQPVGVPVSMTLSVNGVPCSPDSLSRCRYFFFRPLAGGDSLAIDVDAGGRHVHARTYVPLTPDFSNIKIVKDFDTRTFRYYEVGLDFQDHGGIAEYYNLRVMVRDSGIRYNDWERRYDTVDTVHATYFLLRSNPAITGDASYSSPMMGYLYTRNFFNDSEIDGQNYHLAIDIVHLVDTNEVVDSVHTFKHEYTVCLESVTYARLRYLIDVSRQGSSGGFFSEQGAVRGNVEGALGIFAGSAKSEVVFWPDTLPTFPANKIPPAGLDGLRRIPHR